MALRGSALLDNELSHSCIFVVHLLSVAFDRRVLMTRQFLPYPFAVASSVLTRSAAGMFTTASRCLRQCGQW